MYVFCHPRGPESSRNYKGFSIIFPKMLYATWRIIRKWKFFIFRPISESENFGSPFLCKKKPNLQKIVGNLLDKLSKLHIKRKREMIKWTPKEECMDFLAKILLTYSVRKYLKFTLENLYVDKGAKDAVHNFLWNWPFHWWRVLICNCFQ